jgi:hypothetical protein
MGILDLGLIRRVRQHHAIEHATVTILMLQDRTVQLVGGRSNHRGFYIYGLVETDALRTAVVEALRRLQGGEAELAIHPNCGTNLVTAGTLAGLATFTTTAIARRQKTSILDQIPAAIVAATAGLLLGRPLGLRLQKRVTTLADVRDLRLGAIERRQAGRWVQHFVTIEANS